MGRSGVVAILAAILAIALAMPVSAAGEQGTIRVHGEPGLADSGLMLCYVGQISAGGLQLNGDFGGGYVAGQDMQTRTLVHWLEELAKNGTTKQFDRDGIVMFTGLERGVYLLVQQEAAPGYYAMEPMLVALPESDGSWMAQAYPKVQRLPYEGPQTGQPVAPILGGMGMALSSLGMGAWYDAWHKRRRS